MSSQQKFIDLYNYYFQVLAIFILDKLFFQGKETQITILSSMNRPQIWKLLAAFCQKEEQTVMELRTLFLLHTSPKKGALSVPCMVRCPRISQCFSITLTSVRCRKS